MNGRLLTIGVATAIAASAALTGCGSKTVTQGAAPIHVNPSTPAPSTSAGGTMTKEAITKPVGVSDQGRTLTVSTTTGGCKTAQLVAHESTASVTLTVEVTDHHKPGQMCPDLARLTQVHAQLAAPLDQRHVFDGATGKQVPTRTT